MRYFIGKIMGRGSKKSPQTIWELREDGMVRRIYPTTGAYYTHVYNWHYEKNFAPNNQTILEEFNEGKYWDEITQAQAMSEKQRLTQWSGIK